MSSKTKKLSLLITQYLEKKGQLLICISGLSGAGKTYNSCLLAKLINLPHFDQDDFCNASYKMPKFQFSNGLEQPNWDCKEAINLDYMNKIINKYISKGIIFSGFACRDNWFEHKIDLQIHLSINEETCYTRRQEQKKDDPIDGKVIVKELVYPFYQQTLKYSRIDYTIDANIKSDETLDLIIDKMIIFFQSQI